MTRTFQHNRARNEALLCEVSGCSVHRNGLHPYCRAHSKTYLRLGHPRQVAIRASAWSDELKEVRDLFAGQAQHPALQQAMRWIADLTARATEDEGAFIGADEFARLARAGVSSRAIVEALCAVSLYLHRNTHAVRSDRAHDVALSRAIFGLAPRPRRLVISAATPIMRKPAKNQTYSLKSKPASLVAVGKLCRSALAAFIVNVQLSIETLPDKAREAVEAMSIPFDASSVPSLSAV